MMIFSSVLHDWQDAVLLTETYKNIREAKEAEYGF